MGEEDSKMKTPRIIRKRKTNPAGIAVELIGIILCFIFFPLGLIIGIILLVCGGRMALKLVCSECLNPVDSRQVKLCPTCKTTFGKTTQPAPAAKKPTEQPKPAPPPPKPAGRQTYTITPDDI